MISRKRKHGERRVLAALLAAVLFAQQVQMVTLAEELAANAGGSASQTIEITSDHSAQDTSQTEEHESAVEIVKDDAPEQKEGSDAGNADKAETGSMNAAEKPAAEEVGTETADGESADAEENQAESSETDAESKEQTDVEAGSAAEASETSSTAQEDAAEAESSDAEAESVSAESAEGTADGEETDAAAESVSAEEGTAGETAGDETGAADTSAEETTADGAGAEDTAAEETAAGTDAEVSETEETDPTVTETAAESETSAAAAEETVSDAESAEEETTVQETTAEETVAETTADEETAGAAGSADAAGAADVGETEAVSETESVNAAAEAGQAAGGAAISEVPQTILEELPTEAPTAAPAKQETVTINIRYAVMTDGKLSEDGGSVSRAKETIKIHDKTDAEADEEDEDTDEEEILGSVAEANDGYTFTGWTLKVKEEDPEDETKTIITYEQVSEEEELIPDVDLEESATFEYFANFEKEAEPIVITLRYSVKTDGEDGGEGGSISRKEEVIEIPAEEAEEDAEVPEIQGAAAEAAEGYTFTGWTLVSADGEEEEFITDEEMLIPEVDMDVTAVYEYAANFETTVIPMPAQFFTDYANSIRINVTAPEGAFPEGTVMKATPVYDETVVEQITEGMELADNEVVKTVRAVDIAFYHDDIEIEPLIPIHVELKTNEITEESKVVHLDNAGAVTEMEASIDTASRINNATFESDAFSIYAVVETGVDARVFVNFYNGETLVLATSITRNQVDTELNTLIYDPGVGTLEDSQLFKGWTDNEHYTAEGLDEGGENTPMFIDDIRTYVISVLNNAGTTDGTTINLYAMVFNSYHVSYRDELGVTIFTDEVLYKTEGEAVSYTVDHAYAPYYATKIDEDHEELSAKFSGWKQIDPEPASVTLYDNGEEIADLAALGLTKQKNELTLMAQVDYGHWIVFEQNGSGASFTEAVFVQKGQDLSEVKPTDPHWTGYDFYAWFDTKEHADALNADGSHQDTGKFVFSGTDLTQNTTLYAGWTTAATANITVLVWKSRLNASGEESGYDFVRAITVEDVQVNAEMSSVLSTDPGNDSRVYVQPKEGDPEEVYIVLQSEGEPDTINRGFIYDHYDTNMVDDKVSNDGNSVLNVYFHRRTYTLKFVYGRGGSSSTSPSALSTTTEVVSSVTDGDADWANASPTVTFTPGTETVSGNKYYYYGLSAKYGQNISALWPTYDMFPDVTSGWATYRLVSWYLMEGAKAIKGAGGSGQGSVKGKLTVMDEQVLGDLTDPEGNFLISSYYASNPNNWTYRIYFQDANGTVTHGGKTYSLHDTVAVRSRGTNASSQHAPAYPGYTNIDEAYTHISGSNYRMDYYYEPVTHTVIFKDGVYTDPRNSRQLANKSNNTLTTKSYQYGQDISEGDTVDPTSLIDDGSRFIFVGWYDDSACNTPHTFTGETMPETDVTVYARWRLKEYEVKLHPNTDGDESFKYKNGNGEGHYGTYGDVFWVDNGESIDDVGGTRDYYELVSWFANEQLSKVWNFSFSLNDTIVNKYGKLYSEEEIDEDYPATVGEINLYAFWRHILEGADGINVIYDANGGSNAPSDANSYTDQAKAIAYPACTAPVPAQGEQQSQFQYWVVQKWDEDSDNYVDTDQAVFPGDRYTVLKDNSKCVVTEWKDSEGHTSSTYSEDQYNIISKATYTIQLRAEYDTTQEIPPTHISWYKNDGTEAFRVDEIIGEGSDAHHLNINEAVDIAAAQTRAGYNFLGWAKVDTGRTAEAAAQWEAASSNWNQTLDEDNLYLHYAESDSTFHLTSTTGTKVTEVAADEMLPYQAMFAVWDPFTYTVRFHKNAEDASGEMADQIFAYDEEKALTANAFTREEYNFKGWSLSPESTAVAYINQQSVKNLTDEDEGVVNLYAVWERKQAQVTVHHYLNGTTTAVKEDDTATANVGTTYTAVPAATYQGKTLTVKSYDPEQTITVSATDSENVITVYYTLPLTITVEDRTNVPYTGAEQYGYGEDAEDHVTVDGLLEGDSISALNYTRAAGTNVGSDYTGSFSAVPAITNGTAEVSYYVITPTPGKLTIVKAEAAELGLTVTNYNDTYDGAAHSVTAAATVTEGTTISYSTDNATWSTTAPTWTDVTAAQTVYVKAENSNYETATASGTVTITQLAITVNDTMSVAYDGTPKTLTITADKATGVLDNETLTLNGATITGTDQGTYTNVSAFTWSVAKADGSGSTANYTITVTGTLIINRGHLNVTKTTTSQPADGEAYKLGETISYEITVTNDGNLTITNITVTDELTGGEWEIESLAPNAAETFTTTYVVTEADVLAGKVKNVATATGTSPDPDEPDVPVTPGTKEDPTEEPEGHLNVTKTTTSQPADGEAYKLGETIAYQITVTNDGNLTITNITVTDALTGDNWNVASLAPKAAETFTATYVVTEADILAGTVKNIATATGTSPDPDEPDVPVTPGTTEDPAEEPEGHLTVTKTTTSQPADGKTYKLGETLLIRLQSPMTAT